MVPEEHLLAQLTVLDPARELNVRELIPQKLWPKETLGTHKSLSSRMHQKAIILSTNVVQFSCNTTFSN